MPRGLVESAIIDHLKQQLGARDVGFRITGRQRTNSYLIKVSCDLLDPLGLRVGDVAHIVVSPDQLTLRLVADDGHSHTTPKIIQEFLVPLSDPASMDRLDEFLRRLEPAPHGERLRACLRKLRRDRAARSRAQQSAEVKLFYNHLTIANIGSQYLDNP